MAISVWPRIISLDICEEKISTCRLSLLLVNYHYIASAGLPIYMIRGVSWEPKEDDIGHLSI